jgi:hypothetical protein
MHFEKSRKVLRVFESQRCSSNIIRSKKESPKKKRLVKQMIANSNYAVLLPGGYTGLYLTLLLAQTPENRLPDV